MVAPDEPSKKRKKPSALSPALWCAALLGACLYVSGCVVGPKYQPPKMDLPASFDESGLPEPTTEPSRPATGPSSRSARPTRPVELARWWKSLDDPLLNGLVRRAIRSNYNLQIALNRLQETRSLEFTATGGFVPGLGTVPDIDLAAGGGRSTGTNTARGRVPGPLHSGTNTTGLQEITQVAGFDSAWEMDFFGHYARQIEAAQADTQAAIEDRNYVLISVVADLVRTYVDVRGLQYRLAIARQNVGIQRRTLELVRVRFRQGLTNDLDVALAERQLSSTLSTIAPLEAAVRAAERRVAVLVGQFPDQRDLMAELDNPVELPAPPPQVAAGMPVELLRRRPDIRAAERRLASATALVGVATADLFPRVVLTGAAGVQGQGLGRAQAQNSFIWSIGPALYWPFLDFGQLDAVVQARKFRQQQLLSNYQLTVVAAVEEVDNALSAYAADQDSLAQLGAAVEASKRAAALAQQRYNNGLTDFLNVLDAQRQLYALEDQYGIALQDLIRQYIALYKALGGGWEGYEAPPPPAPRPAILAAGAEVIHPSKN